ncbi:MAG: bifunctional DNA-binding transcriptional regulator/O6-methylguanine-DNA methyltransferase Ada [Gemmatimonadales bacterium]|nr:MAG: bifunctional DNA-binding transcriptional regulator/O6-methylguanine-DNA methyltransferase Ada [Gemmatimonadales bacterium]
MQPRTVLSWPCPLPGVALVVPVLSESDLWNAVLTRDHGLAGAFVYGVRSTGIYCRAGCPARRPHRENVEFFAVPAAAEQGGYRPCRRCLPREAVRRHPQIDLVERACRVMETANGGRLTLDALGARVGVSPSHLQRTFKRFTGVSPRAYADTLRASRLRDALREGESVSRALYSAGYGSPSRVYEHGSGVMGMTPATYRKGGTGVRIAFATAASPLGRVLVASTERGVCFVSLADTDRELLAALQAEFPEAKRVRGGVDIQSSVDEVIARVSGTPPSCELALDIRATAFQRRVWEELRHVPVGETVSYAGLAKRIGAPRAVRAVASACARNNVAVIIPCHRVLRTDGTLGGYRWGRERKEKLLTAERGNP